jgi:hypothetical protein
MCEHMCICVCVMCRKGAALIHLYLCSCVKELARTHV